MAQFETQLCFFRIPTINIRVTTPIRSSPNIRQFARRWWHFINSLCSVSTLPLTFQFEPFEH